MQKQQIDYLFFNVVGKKQITKFTKWIIFTVHRSVVLSIHSYLHYERDMQRYEIGESETLYPLNHSSFSPPSPPFFFSFYESDHITHLIEVELTVFVFWWPSYFAQRRVLKVYPC